MREVYGILRVERVERREAPMQEPHADGLHGHTDTEAHT